MLTVAVEGNIGAGKSSFMNMFNTATYKILKEPISEWTNLNGHNLLALMYNDPSKWSASFQSYAMLSMLKIHCGSVKEPVKLIERCIFSGRHVFMEHLKRQGHLDEPTLVILHEWWDFVVQKFQPAPDLIIYLRTTPTVALSRVQSRDRAEESGLNIKAMETLHELYENWIARAPCPVITLNANVNKEGMEENVNICSQLLSEMILNQ